MLFVISREDCPYCREAKKNLRQLFCKYPQFFEIPVRLLSEGEKLYSAWDYYYLPAFFWEEEKLAEGCYTEEDLKRLLERVHERQFFGKDNPKKGGKDEEKDIQMDRSADVVRRSGVAGAFLCTGSGGSPCGGA